MIIEFDSVEQGQRFYASREYQAALAARGDSARVRMVLVEGSPERKS